MLLLVGSLQRLLQILLILSILKVRNLICELGRLIVLDLAALESRYLILINFLLNEAGFGIRITVFLVTEVGAFVRNARLCIGAGHP